MSRLSLLCRCPALGVAELLNDTRRCVMRVLAVQKSASKEPNRWQSEDLRCVSRVHTGSNSSDGSSTGRGVALWVFSDDDVVEASSLYAFKSKLALAMTAMRQDLQ